VDLELLVEYFFNVDIMQKALPSLLSGLWVTIKVSVTIIVLGFIVGLILAVIRTTHFRYLSRPLNIIIRLYVNFLRASPSLVLVTLVYYGLAFLGIDISAFWATVITFGACLSAYAEEILRAGIEAIDRGQVEAARAIGLSHLKSMRYVIMPWVFRATIPTLTNTSIAITKDISMASAIALPELLKQARHMQALLANPTPLIEAAIIYVLLFLPFVRLVSILERKRHSKDTK
jgi:polar amino acid transport system permease protein